MPLHNIGERRQPRQQVGYLLVARGRLAAFGELAHNPRARSAKLRAAERCEAPARDEQVSDLLPRLPALGDIVKGR